MVVVCVRGGSMPRHHNRCSVSTLITLRLFLMPIAAIID
jgi:hypothetical protein